MLRFVVLCSMMVGSVYMSEDLMACAANTGFGAKLLAAHGACGEGEAAGRKMRDNLMRNADECPTMEEFLGRLEEDYAVESCYLANMGWLDLEAGAFNKEVIGADLATLPAEITANISDESVGTCAEQALEVYGNHPCANNFSDEEMEVLVGYLSMIEEYECLKAQLEQGCSAHLSG